MRAGLERRQALAAGIDQIENDDALRLLFPARDNEIEPQLTLCVQDFVQDLAQDLAEGFVDDSGGRNRLRGYN